MNTRPLNIEDSYVNVDRKMSYTVIITAKVQRMNSLHYKQPAVTRFITLTNFDIIKTKYLRV